MFDQIGPGIRPSILRVQFNWLTIIISICFQLYFNAVRPFTTLIVIVIPDLFNSDFRSLPCVRKLGAGGRCTDPSRLTCICCRELTVHFFYDIVSNACRQACRRLGFITVKRERRLVVCEGHLAVDAVQHAFPGQFNSEFEFFLRIRRNAADDCLADFQVACLPRVVEYRGPFQFLCAALIPVICSFSLIGGNRAHLRFCHNNFRIVLGIVRFVNSTVDCYRILALSDPVIICAFVFILNLFKCNAGSDVFNSLFFFPLAAVFFVQLEGKMPWRHKVEKLPTLRNQNDRRECAH